MHVDRAGYYTLRLQFMTQFDRRFDLELFRDVGPGALFGVLTEMTPAGPVAIEGAAVDDWINHLSTTSSADGSYRLSPVEGGYAYITVSKRGFKYLEAHVGVSGETRMDIRLEREK